MRAIPTSARKESYVVGLRNAERRGREDFKAGVPFEANPYRRFEMRICWSDEWRAAQALAAISKGKA